MVILERYFILVSPNQRNNILLLLLFNFFSRYNITYVVYSEIHHSSKADNSCKILNTSCTKYLLVKQALSLDVTETFPY